MNVQVDYRLIGQRIREHRRQAHLTQAELAERSGVCTQFVGSLERGLAIPSLATVLSLCHALSIEPNALLLHAASYDPDAPCSLHASPSPAFQALTRRPPKDIANAAPESDSFDCALLPAFDITLDEFIP